MSKSHYIIDDVYNIYSSIHEERDSETIEEIDNFAGDVYAAIVTSMLHEGYSASGILGFLSTASDEEILERFGDFNEDLITESTISEEYVIEQVEQLDEIVGAALRVLGGAAKAAKFAKGAKGLAPLSRIGAGLKGAGQAMSRVAKQGPKASSVVRAGISKVRGAASKGLSALKSGAAKVGGAIKTGAAKAAPIAKKLIPGVIGGAIGYGLGKMGGGGKSSPGPSTPGPSTPGPGNKATTTAPAPAKPAAPAAPKKDRMAGAPKKDRMAAFAKANPKLAARQAERDRTRGTSATTNPLMKDMKAGLPAPKPKATAASDAVKSSEKKQSRLDKALSSVKTGSSAGKETKKESYDIVLDYLLSEGHAESVEEAHYIMLRLEEDHIQEIISEGPQAFPFKKVEDKMDKLRPGSHAKNIDRTSTRFNALGAARSAAQRREGGV
jgi:hypothetical protein